VAYQARADASFAATYRADTKNIPEASLPEKPSTADSSLRLEGTAGTASWQVSGSADGVWSNQPAEGLDHFEGGNYLAALRVGGLTGQLGQLDPQLESSIISYFQRRGTMLSYLDRRQVVQASGFALRAEPVAGFHEGLGIHDPDNRVVGGALTLRPIPRHGEWLTLTGIYLVGKQGADPGVAVLDQSALSRGNAWSVGFVSGLFNQRLRLQGEYAATRFDADGPGELAEAPDKAYGGSAVWDLLRDARIGELPLNGAIGGEFRYTGPGFASLANAGLPTDLQMEKAFTRWGLGGLNAEVVAGREHDNVEDDPALAGGRTDLLAATAAYSPTLAPEGWAQAVFGQPRLDLGYQELRDRTVDLPEGETDKPDRRNREWSAGLGSSYRIWDWRAGYRSRREKDLTGAAADRTGEYADANLGFRFRERVTLGLRGQLTRDKDIGTSLSLTNTLTGADITVILVRNYLTAQLSYQADRQKSSDDSQNRLTQTTDFGLELTLLQARENRPGIALSLRGQQQRVDDRLNDENDGEPFQVYLTLNIGWSMSTSGTWR